MQDAYSAETQLTKALPKLAKAAASADLRAVFEQHLAETKNQLARLEKVCEQVGCKTGSNTCEAMEGLIKEGEEVMGLGLDTDAQDAGLIAASQKVEHYEIALYGTLCAFAKQLGHPDARLLHETLDEEKRTVEKLAQLAARGSIRRPTSDATPSRPLDRGHDWLRFSFVYDRHGRPVTLGRESGNCSSAPTRPRGVLSPTPSPRCTTGSYECG